MTTDSAAASTPPTKRRRGFLVFLRDVLVIVVIAALVSFVVKTFVVRSFYIPSASMERTLMVKDRILVDELTPRWNDYERGDVVVFKDPGGWLDGQPQTPAHLRSSKRSTGCSTSSGSLPRTLRITSSNG